MPVIHDWFIKEYLVLLYLSEAFTIYLQKSAPIISILKQQSNGKAIDLWEILF